MVASAGVHDFGSTTSAMTVADDHEGSALGGSADLAFPSRTLGQITVVKQTAPDGAAQVFQFTASWGSFSLRDGESDTRQVRPGKHAVSEALQAGWTLGSAVCSDGSPISAIILSPRENVVCTFTNVQAPQPPISPPVSPPITPPVTIPICPPVSPPVSGPVTPPITPPISPPISPPVTRAVSALTTPNPPPVCVFGAGLSAFLGSGQARLVGGVAAAIIAFSSLAGLAAPVADRARRRYLGS